MLTFPIAIPINQLDPLFIPMHEPLISLLSCFDLPFFYYFSISYFLPSSLKFYYSEVASTNLFGRHSDLFSTPSYIYLIKMI